MEKMTQEKKSEKRSGGPRKELSDFVLKITAVIIAIIIWFALSITQYPTVNKTITNVPVDFSMHGTTAETKGLSALGYKDISVDVEIQGMNYEIGTYTASDLIATVNLDSVNKEGTYELDIDVRSSHSADKCSVISVTPETVEVKFDRIDSASFGLQISAPNVSAAEGYTLKESTTSPENIEVSGPENELERIDRVVAVYAESRVIDEDTTVSTDSLLFYDADDNLLDSSNYTLSAKKADINFVVYKKVTAQISVEYTDVPPGFDTSSLPLNINPESLSIITPQLDAASTEDIKLKAVSLYKLIPGQRNKFDIDSLLSAGEINQSGVDQIELSIDSNTYDKRTFQIPTKNIQYKNVPEGKEVAAESDQITNITMIGPKEYIEKLKVSDLTAEIDLSDISANGSISHEVVIYSGSYHNIWNIGTHEVVINVSDSSESTKND